MATLGLPGDLVREGEHVDHTVTKVGGQPVLPPDFAGGPSTSPRCPSCGVDLCLVLQAHAPVKGIDVRAIYVFACARAGCAKQFRHWHAVRAQANPREREGGEGDGRALEAREGGEQSDMLFEDVWGEDPLAGDDSGPADDDDNLVASLESAMAASSLGARAGGRVGRKRNKNKAHAAPAETRASEVTNNSIVADVDGAHGSSPAACALLTPSASLPSFYIHAAWEPASSASSRAMDAHVAELAERYREEAGEDEGWDLAEGVASAGGKGGKGSKGGKGDGEWRGERYEGTLAKGKSRFAKFADRLALAPSQCVRYHLGGRPLWPGEGDPCESVPRCAVCGSARRFELQVMSPVMHYLEEASQWLEEEAAGKREADQTAPSTTGEREAAAGGSLALDLSAVELATVAVFTCARSCKGDGTSGMFPEECVAIGEGGAR